MTIRYLEWNPWLEIPVVNPQRLPADRKRPIRVQPGDLGYGWRKRAAIPIPIFRFEEVQQPICARVRGARCNPAATCARSLLARHPG